MKNTKLNINLVCLFKGFTKKSDSIEIGGYVDAMLLEPFSLATAYLKAYALKDKGIKEEYNLNLLNLIDEGKGKIDSVTYSDRFVDIILNNKPFAIGFSTYCWNVDSVLKIIRKIKKICPKIKIVIGGRYALIEYLKMFPEIDFIIRGEGEIAFFKLLKNRFSKTQYIKGVSYLANGKLINGGESEIVNALDEIPSPYLEEIIKPNQFNMMIELSRGCLNNCGYCNWNSNKMLRTYSKNRITNELFFAIKNRVKHIAIIDSAINYSTKTLRDFSKAVQQSNAESHLNFSYNLRYEYVDTNQIIYLKKIPSFQVLLGLESVNYKALHLSNRSINITSFENSIKLLNRYCNPLVGVILGLPGDTPKEFKKTIRYLEALNSNLESGIGAVLVSLLQVFPGSLLYEKREDYKIKVFNTGVPYIKSNLTWNYKELVNINRWLNNYSKNSKLNIKGIEGGWRLQFKNTK